MKLTIDEASKLIKTIREELNYLSSVESNCATYSYFEGEEPIVPEFNLTAHQEAVDKFNTSIEKIKHEINKFNCSYVLPNAGITIDVALVRMAVLTSRVAVLTSMRATPPKRRTRTLRDARSEFTETNYTTEEIESLYTKASAELTLIRSEINIANVNNTIEVDVDLEGTKS